MGLVVFHLVVALLGPLFESATSSANLFSRSNSCHHQESSTPPTSTIIIPIITINKAKTSTGSFSQPVSPTNLPGCFSTYLRRHRTSKPLTSSWPIIFMSIKANMKCVVQVKLPAQSPRCAGALVNSLALFRSFANANLCFGTQSTLLHIFKGLQLLT